MKNLNLKDFGAKPDGVFNNGEAFKTAFEEIAKNGGGKLTVDAGNWLTGPIDIPSDTTLELSEGARIVFVDDPALYPPAFTRWEGRRMLRNACPCSFCRLKKRKNHWKRHN